MLFLELRNKKEIDAAPPRQLAGQISSLDSKVDQNTSNMLSSLSTTKQGLVADISKTSGDIQNLDTAVGGLRASQTTLFRDLSSVKNDVHDRTAEAQQQAAVAAQKAQAAQVEVNRTKQQVESLGSETPALRQELQKRATSAMLYSLRNDLESQQASTDGQVSNLRSIIDQIGLALSGNLHLVLDSEEEEVSAAALNAAAAEAFTKTFLVSLCAQWTVEGQTLNRIHSWAGFDTVLTPAEDCVDPDIGAPTVDGETLQHGVAQVTVTFDTDAGVTKTYAVDDEVTVTVQVAADDKRLGYTVTQVVKTYTVVAQI